MRALDRIATLGERDFDLRFCLQAVQLATLKTLDGQGKPYGLSHLQKKRQFHALS